VYKIFAMHILQSLNNLIRYMEGFIKRKNTPLSLCNFRVEISFITIFHDHEDPSIV